MKWNWFSEKQTLQTREPNRTQKGPLQRTEKNRKHWVYETKRKWQRGRLKDQTHYRKQHFEKWTCKLEQSHLKKFITKQGPPNPNLNVKRTSKLQQGMSRNSMKYFHVTWDANLNKRNKIARRGWRNRKMSLFVTFLK